MIPGGDRPAARAPLNRREFLYSCSVLAGGALVYPARPLDGGDGTTQAGFWYQQPLRILQTVLRETDAVGYDADAVVEYMRQAGCNTLVVNAGGIVDFFRNPLPAANLNPFLGERDILREISTAVRAAGFRIIARVDFRGVEEPVYRAHPEWFSLDAHGHPLQLTYTRPELYASCYTGFYRTEHAERFIRYLLDQYDLDGIWHNSIGVVGICYCGPCRRSYRLNSGRELPVQGQATDEELARYMIWKEKVADRHMEHMKNTVKAFGDEKVYTAEVFNMFYGTSQIDLGIDLYNARDHFDFLVSVAFLTPNQERIVYEDLFYAGSVVRFLKSMAPEKEAIILYGENGTAHRYTRDAPIDLNVWLWEAAAAGGRFWNCYFNGPHPAATHDRRNAYNNVEAYSFVRQHEAVLADQVPVQPVGIYYSKATRLSYRRPREEGGRFNTSIQGMETVLIENHVPYGFLADDQVSTERLASYALLILPNVRCLADREIELITRYVADGGRLLATYATSLYDEHAVQRADFGLAHLFGCRYAGNRVNTRRDAYQYIRSPAHPLVQRHSRATELLVNYGFTLLCDADADAEVICTYNPPVHNQPPEKAWAPEWHTDHPTLVVHRFGRGQVVYFANQPDHSTYEMGHPDLRSLLIDSMRYLAGDRLPITTNAPESVHVGLTRSRVDPTRYVFSLVNTTSAPQRPLRGLVPVQDLRVSLDLAGMPLRDHRVLRSQGACQVRGENGRIELAIERLEDFFAVQLRTVG
jgi:hypothetical protein